MTDAVADARGSASRLQDSRALRTLARVGFAMNGLLHVLIGGIALTVVFAFGLAWVYTTMGLVLRSPSAVMNTGFMTLFPLIFLSNIFVAPSTLPNVLEKFVEINPISHVVTAVRGLFAGNPDTGDILLVLGEAGVLAAIFVPLTTRLYRRRR